MPIPGPDTVEFHLSDPTPRPGQDETSFTNDPAIRINLRGIPAFNRVCVQETPEPPSAPQDPCFVSPPPTSHTFRPVDGERTLYLWTIDPAGTMAGPFQAGIRLDLTPPPKPARMRLTSYRAGEADFLWEKGGLDESAIIRHRFGHALPPEGENCTSPHATWSWLEQEETKMTLHALQRGFHCFALVQIDGAGNASPPRRQTLPVDPSASAALPLTSGPDDCTLITTWSGYLPQSYGGWSAAVDPDHGRYFLSQHDQNRVLIYESSPDTGEMKLTKVLGQPSFEDCRLGNSASSMNWPTDVEYDRDHQRLFVADVFNSRILVFDLSDGIRTDQDAAWVIGSTQAPLPSRLNAPHGVSYDRPHNRLFVADSGGNRVLVFPLDEIGNDLPASHVLGQPDFGSHEPGATRSIVHHPHGVEYGERRNRLFVLDSNNNRILVFELDRLENGMDASYVIGQPDFTTIDEGHSRSGIAHPNDAAHDPEREVLYYPDHYNHRILKFRTDQLENGMAASAVIGQPDFDTFESEPAENPARFIWPVGIGLSRQTGELLVADRDRLLVFNLPR